MKSIRNTLALAAALIVLGTAGVAAAGNAGDGEEPYVGPSPEVLSETLVAPAPAPEAAVAGTASNATDVQSADLAFTGGDVTALAAAGLIVVFAGGALLLVRRRNHALDGA